jgi:hypothetical protein
MRIIQGQQGSVATPRLVEIETGDPRLAELALGLALTAASQLVEFCPAEKILA